MIGKWRWCLLGSLIHISLVKYCSKWLENCSGASWAVFFTFSYSILNWPCYQICSGASWAVSFICSHWNSYLTLIFEMTLGPPGQFPLHFLIKILLDIDRKLLWDLLNSLLHFPLSNSDSNGLGNGAGTSWAAFLSKLLFEIIGKRVWRHLRSFLHISLLNCAGKWLCGLLGSFLHISFWSS